LPSIAELTFSPQHHPNRNHKPYTSSGIAYPSIKYTYDEFIEALHIMAVQGSGADFQFFWENDDKDQYIYGLVNLAAFLADAGGKYTV
jgi:predicted AlkP superfamily phosphohydrolase/phosphomutase